MFFRCAALACVFLSAPAALACSLKSGAQPFVVQGQGSSASSEGLKAPVVEVVSITRGIGTRHASCDDTGLLSLKVEWPRGTANRGVQCDGQESVAVQEIHTEQLDYANAFLTPGARDTELGFDVPTK